VNPLDFKNHAHSQVYPESANRHNLRGGLPKPTAIHAQLPAQLGMAKIFNMAKMCVEPKKRHKRLVVSSYKKKTF
jgi:hypothetical protein